METVAVNKPTHKIPEALIYDLMDGKPYYRKGYKSVLNKTQTLESIMGCSSLQTLVIEYLMEMFFTFSNYKKYHFFTNEPGIHLSKGNNLSGDVCIFEKSKEQRLKFDTHYFNTPPLVQIEVDVTATMEEDETTYINKKVNKLLDFGVSKVIWIFTAAESVLLATPNGPWQWMNWRTDVELIEGLSINIGQYIASVNEEQ